MSNEMSKLSANSFISFQIILNLSEQRSVSKVFIIPFIKLTELSSSDDAKICTTRHITNTAFPRWSINKCVYDKNK